MGVWGFEGLGVLSLGLWVWGSVGLGALSLGLCGIWGLVFRIARLKL